MDKRRIIQAFADIGARATVQPLPWPDFAEADRPIEVRVARDGEGDYFDVRVHPHLPVTRVAATVYPHEQRLVLTLDSLGDTHRFACGRDGDAWYATPLDPVEALAAAPTAQPP